LHGVGCDMHPLAAKISSAKVGILTVERSQCSEILSAFLARVEYTPIAFPKNVDQFGEEILGEIFSWFPEPVVYKLNWILSLIETIGNPIVREFLQVLLSNIIRDVSQQEPRDLRIRRRKQPIEDAPVIELFADKLGEQIRRLSAFWSVSKYQPSHSIPAHVIAGDSRDPRTFSQLGLSEGSVDLIVTSPPYATALPYIDTDRLSLLVLFGMESQERGLLEKSITGSREITKKDKLSFEASLYDEGPVKNLPLNILEFLRNIHDRNQQADVGFRRENSPSLLVRYFEDMAAVFQNMANVLKPRSDAFVVIGDSRTRVDGKMLQIPTTQFLADIGELCGFECVEQIQISVTTENLKHIKNAIVENTVLHFRSIS